MEMLGVCSELDSNAMAPPDLLTASVNKVENKGVNGQSLGEPSRSTVVRSASTAELTSDEEGQCKRTRTSGRLKASCQDCVATGASGSRSGQEVVNTTSLQKLVANLPALPPGLRVRPRKSGCPKEGVSRRTSSFRGVSFHGPSGKWRARIKVGSQEVRLGYFSTESEAARAYDEAATVYHGAEAWLNFPTEEHSQRQAKPSPTQRQPRAAAHPPPLQQQSGEPRSQRQADAPPAAAASTAAEPSRAAAARSVPSLERPAPADARLLCMIDRKMRIRFASESDPQQPLFYECRVVGRPANFPPADAQERCFVVKWTGTAAAAEGDTGDCHWSLSELLEDAQVQTADGSWAWLGQELLSELRVAQQVTLSQPQPYAMPELPHPHVHPHARPEQQQQLQHQQMQQLQQLQQRLQQQQQQQHWQEQQQQQWQLRLHQQQNWQLQLQQMQLLQQQRTFAPIAAAAAVVAAAAAQPPAQAAPAKSPALIELEKAAVATLMTLIQ